MSSKEDKDLSLVLCSTLDNLGFKKESISLRSKFSEEKTQLKESLIKKIGFTYTVVPAGSFSEGVKLSGSDSDFMFVCDDVVCLDHGDVNRNFTILETDYINTAPGYTKLVVSHDIRLDSVYSLFFRMSCIYDSDRSNPYISSLKFKQLYLDGDTVAGRIMKFEDSGYVRTTNGPAVTRTITSESRSYECDNVYSVYFYGGEYLPRWANRSRYYLWPSKDVVKEITEMEGYVVPVGDKQSENHYLEWRICYTTAEKKLVSHLDDIQLKLYVLLKLLAKHILKPVCKALTSYVVKNVVFWVTETTPPEEFSPDNLVHLVLKSLFFVKHCFENNHFPNYMIPERNLLRGAVCGQEKKAIINFLSKSLTEGIHIILRIPKLYHCMSFMAKNPECMGTYGRWRNEIERLIMVVTRQTLNSFDSKLLLSTRLVHEVYQDYNVTETPEKVKLLLSVLPDYLSLILAGKSEEDIAELFKKRLDTVTFL